MFKFPYTNLHELNLDWILEKVKTLVENNDEFNDKADYAVETADEAKAIAEQALLPDGAVTTAKIADYAVTQVKLAVNSVGNYQLQNNSVDTAKLADGSVTTAKLADEAVTTAKINDGAVTTAKINDASITKEKIGNGAVTNSRIGDGAVTKSKLNSDITDRTTQTITETYSGVGTFTIVFRKLFNVVTAQMTLHTSANYSAQKYDLTVEIPDGYRPSGFSYVTAYCARTDGGTQGMGTLMLWGSGFIQYGALNTGTSGVDVMATATYVVNV